MTDLASRVRQRARELAALGDEDLGATSLLCEPLSPWAIDAAENALGLPIPASLKEMYAGVANGGFGPGYGLMGLSGGARNEDGRDAMGQYQMYRTPDPADPLWSWPTSLLPVISLGCAMYLCVDTLSSEGMVTWFEPALLEPGSSPVRAFVPLERTFASLMDGWVAGEHLVDVLEAAGPAT